jgi:hypothetical protein
MKANQLVQKLAQKLLGKKANTPASDDVATVIQLAPEENTPEIAFRIHDGLGAIQLPENWRN